MTTNVINEVAYLPTSRNYPKDTNLLVVEVNKSYVDIANAVNSRIIGLFSTKVPSITGESWFLSNKRQQGFRKVFEITSFAPIPHGLQFEDIFSFTKIYGVFLSSGPVQYLPLPYVNVVAANQIGIAVQATNIVFNVGIGAPPITRGLVIIEWISNV